jgi:hypothetical protein
MEDEYRVKVDMKAAGPFAIDCSQESILKTSQMTR